MASRSPVVPRSSGARRGKAASTKTAESKAKGGTAKRSAAPSKAASAKPTQKSRRPAPSKKPLSAKALAPEPKRPVAKRAQTSRDRDDADLHQGENGARGESMRAHGDNAQGASSAGSQTFRPSASDDASFANLSWTPEGGGWNKAVMAAWQRMATIPMTGFSATGQLGANSGQWDAEFPNPFADAAGFGAGGSHGRASRGLPPFKVDVLKLAQTDYQRGYQKLVESWLQGGADQGTVSDKRFSGPDWKGPHAALAGLYLLNRTYLTQLAEALEVDEKTRQKVRFAVEQFVEAMSPSNYLATNPEALQRLLTSRGSSLSQGISNMLMDLQKGRISQSDETAFEVGRNIATTPGDVIFRNDIFELIQYRPATKTVFEVPLLLVPPCINKYYILDLQADNSFVQYAVSQGHTVLLMSWRNPDESMASLTWDDYVENGVIEAIDIASALDAQSRLNVLGFCVGGTLLSTALAVREARGDPPVESLTLLTTLLDFSDTGVLDVFVDEAHVTMREATLGRVGRDGHSEGLCKLMPARDLAASFSFLRPNDLIWNYVVNNYLKGESPPPFDLLFWNADSTNLPGPFFTWYLRNTYLENNLVTPGKVRVCGEPVDFSKVAVPTYVYGSREDHIVPWRAAYRNCEVLGGTTRFVLGASGHIAGVINAPVKRKRNYWVGEAGESRSGPEEWLEGASNVAGSWWPDWSQWLAEHSGRQIKAPARPGNRDYSPIEDAPGSYVVVRAN